MSIRSSLNNPINKPFNFTLFTSKRPGEAYSEVPVRAYFLKLAIYTVAILQNHPNLAPKEPMA